LLEGCRIILYLPGVVKRQQMQQQQQQQQQSNKHYKFSFNKRGLFIPKTVGKLNEIGTQMSLIELSDSNFIVT
jgi:hypothetical protein